MRGRSRCQKQMGLWIWIAQTEGTKFWLQVVTDLKDRGMQDIFIACADGLKGFPLYPLGTKPLKPSIHRPRYNFALFT